MMRVRYNFMDDLHKLVIPCRIEGMSTFLPQCLSSSFPGGASGKKSQPAVNARDSSILDWEDR